MNLSHPIRGVIPTLDAAVIEVLAGTTRGLSGREVHRIAGTGSVRGIQLVLARLISQGLARGEEHASATLYTANRAHLAWPPIEAIVGLRERFLARLREQLAGWSIAPVHVSLFGSVARMDGDATSDIDLLLIRPDTVAEADEAWEAQLDALRDHVFSWTGNRCQAFEMDRKRLRAYLQAQDPIVENWLRDEILLAGVSLRTVIDGLAEELRV